MAVAAAERKEVQAMIDLGKKKGHLTVDDINSLLPMDVTSPDQIDDFMVMLEQNDITVILDADEKPAAKGKGKGKAAKGKAAAKEAAKPAEAPVEVKKERDD